MGSNDRKALAGVLDAPEFELMPRYEVSHAGVCYIGVKRDAQTQKIDELPPVRLSDRLEIVGNGEDEGGRGYRILQWHSRDSGKQRRMAFPRALIGEREGWAMLREKGLSVVTTRGLQDKLASYLQDEGPNTLHHVTERSGWNRGAYIVPGGDIIGTPSEPIFYKGDAKDASAYAPHGTLEGWRDGVARLARGNARVMLAMGCAFAAPLLDMIEMEAGGFHIFGDSSDGKTTAAKVGTSVWGHHENTKLGWDATALALANAAASRNDCLMFLDEVGQGNPDAVSQAAYRLFNGVGKLQGAKDGGNREVMRWRVLVISTGEHPIAEMLKEGSKRIKAGQNVRLPSLPADAGKGYGVFEQLHEHETPRALATALVEACGQHYGTAGRAFIEYIAPQRKELAGVIRDYIHAWNTDLPAGVMGQANRVIARFALVALALELATKAGITGWSEGEAHDAMYGLMREWLQRNGTGKHEDRAITGQVETFLALHSYSRFILLPLADDVEPKVANMAGYKRYDATGSPEYIIFPPVFETEVIAGFDPAKAQKVLAEQGLLKKSSDGRFKTMHKTPTTPKGGRFYLLVSGGCDEDAA